MTKELEQLAEGFVKGVLDTVARKLRDGSFSKALPPSTGIGKVLKGYAALPFERRSEIAKKAAATRKRKALISSQKTQPIGMLDLFVEPVKKPKKSAALRRGEALHKSIKSQVKRGLAALPFEQRSEIAKRAAATRKRRAAARKAVETRRARAVLAE